MSIHWYPGHMHKARKEMNKTLKSIDVVIEVLDARIPFSSANPMINQLKGERPVIKLLNKSDLADPDVTAQWQHYFEQEKQVRVLPLNAQDNVRCQTIVSLCQKLAPHRQAANKPVQAMIMGIPNVGKSTIINGLAGRVIAKVGNEPAVTKRQQRIAIGDTLTISDTPGILWPKLEPESCGYRLAASGAVKDTAMEYEDVALFTLAYLRQTYVENLRQRFKLDREVIVSETGDLELLEILGKKRGCLKSGGIVDLYQISSILLQELRSGKLGPISLETPEMAKQELEILRQLIAERQAAREAAEADSKN